MVEAEYLQAESAAMGASLLEQSLGQGGEFRRAVVGPPDDAAIREHPQDDAVRGAAQGFDAITRRVVRRLTELVNCRRHGLVIEHTGDVVRHGRRQFAPARIGKFGEQRGGKLPGNIGEGVAIEEEEGRTPVAVPEEV